MGKNILVIRSGNLLVMDKLFSYLNEKYGAQEVDLYCLVQQNTMPVLQEKYPNVHYVVTHDGFFDYRKFKKNISLRNELSKAFDAIYIPSSTMSFDSYLDVILISTLIGRKKTEFYFFCTDGQVFKKKLHVFELWFEKYCSGFVYLFKLVFSLFLFKILYYITHSRQ